MSRFGLISLRFDRCLFAVSVWGETVQRSRRVGKTHCVTEAGKAAVDGVF